MKENFLADYLSKFITVCFTVESEGKKTQIGKGEPLFNVKSNKKNRAYYQYISCSWRGIYAW